MRERTLEDLKRRELSGARGTCGRRMRGTNVVPFVVMALAAGIVLPFQAGVNAMLRGAVGGPLRASLISFAIGSIVLFLATIAAREPWPGLARALHGPAWMWVGGVLGAAYVAATIVLVPRIGGAVTFALLIAGQMAASLAIDQFGLLGLERHPLSLARIVGAALLVIGVVLIRR